MWVDVWGIVFFEDHFVSHGLTIFQTGKIMPLELRKGRNGKLRSTWYGRYEVSAKKFVVNLGVKVAGNPPDSLSLRDLGDHSFERSRAMAQAKLNQLIEETRRPKSEAHLLQRMYENKAGESLQVILLTNLPDEWQKIPRKRKPSVRYALQSRSSLLRFIEFIQEQYPKVKEITQINRTMAHKFMEAESSRGVSAKTWNDMLKLIRATFKHVAPIENSNPFAGIPNRETETIFRIPFSSDELNFILEAARNDDFIRPILITGICTAMRRGDCCLLMWKDVDLAQRFITVKTAKTGQTVSIPIFPLLLEEMSKKEPSGVHVFPEQAQMYLENPDGITLRVRKVFAAAGFKDSNGKEDDSIRGQIHASRKDGLRQASIRDFHSFRVTWVTLALTAGVPLELVQKVTGHKTTEIVFKHYFQPRREEFRKALESAMPHLLLNKNSLVKEMEAS